MHTRYTVTGIAGEYWHGYTLPCLTIPAKALLRAETLHYENELYRSWNKQHGSCG